MHLGTPDTEQDLPEATSLQLEYMRQVYQTEEFQNEGKNTFLMRHYEINGAEKVPTIKKWVGRG